MWCGAARGRRIKSKAGDDEDDDDGDEDGDDKEEEEEEEEERKRQEGGVGSARGRGSMARRKVAKDVGAAEPGKPGADVKPAPSRARRGKQATEASDGLAEGVAAAGAKRSAGGAVRAGAKRRGERTEGSGGGKMTVGGEDEAGAGKVPDAVPGPPRTRARKGAKDVVAPGVTQTEIEVTVQAADQGDKMEVGAEVAVVGREEAVGVVEVKAEGGRRSLRGARRQPAKQHAATKVRCKTVCSKIHSVCCCVC